jgi:hypothetical protein
MSSAEEKMRAANPHHPRRAVCNCSPQTGELGNMLEVILE